MLALVSKVCQMFRRYLCLLEVELGERESAHRKSMKINLFFKLRIMVIKYYKPSMIFTVVDYNLKFPEPIKEPCIN